MRHPFAAVQSPRPASDALSIASRAPTPDQARLPRTDSKRRAYESLSPPSVPALPSIDPFSTLTPNRFTPRILARRSDTNGHYVKHSSKLTLLLCGQPEGVSMPHYSNGDTIEGILAIARPSGVLSLEVKVRSRASPYRATVVYWFAGRRNGPD